MMQLGCIRDKFDARDYLMRAYLPVVLGIEVFRYMMDAWSSVDIEDPNPLTLASVISYRDNLDNS